MNNMQLALIHSSVGKENNERLEFLGDSILNMLTAEYLYNLYPWQQEGFLAIARAKLVCADNLHRVALRIKIADRLVTGPQCRGVANKNMLADAVEAQIGAMYLEYGLEKVREWVTTYILLWDGN